MLGFIRNGQTLPTWAIFWRGRRGTTTWKAVREGALKFVVQISGTSANEYLFNLEQDLAEQNNLRVEQPVEAAKLNGLLTNWETEVQPIR